MSEQKACRIILRNYQGPVILDIHSDVALALGAFNSDGKYRFDLPVLGGPLVLEVLEAEHQDMSGAAEDEDELS